ncbi:MAG: hypothetical protein SVR04_16540 [Spirochaetota bacterium]|nr:hypothetical protein [Spirochaetota bacterium]
MTEIDALYTEIKKKLSEIRLKELAAVVLDVYKAGNLSKMRMYADALFQSESHGDAPLNKIFVKMIKTIHPDRFAAHLNTVERAYVQQDREVLSFYQTMLKMETAVRRNYEQRFAYDFTEEYRYGEEDFGYDTWEYSEHGGDVDKEEESAGKSGEGPEDREYEFDFIRAVKAEYLGNLNYTLNPADLAALEGELNVAGYGIADTEGLQFCRNITRLDLSCNRIANLYDIQGLIYLSELLISDNQIEQIEYLRGLENLEIIDLSFNEIENIDVLLALDRLQFADLRGNPLQSIETLRELTRRGVVIIR